MLRQDGTGCVKLGSPLTTSWLGCRPSLRLVHTQAAEQGAEPRARMWALQRSPAPMAVNTASVPHTKARRLSWGRHSLGGSAVTEARKMQPAKVAFAKGPALAALASSRSSHPCRCHA